MPTATEQFRKHYASLSEDQLLSLDRNDLTETAQKCYDEEIRRRGISASIADSIDEDSAGGITLAKTHRVPSDDEFFQMCSFAEVNNEQSATLDAAEARDALEAAGIPCRVDVVRVEPEPAPTPSLTYNEYRVLVPSTLMLHARSVLDQQVFNPKEEADWKTHLESLTDDELLQLNEDDICAGLLDRASRLRKTYADELRGRKL